MFAYSCGGIPRQLFVTSPSSVFALRATARLWCVTNISLWMTYKTILKIILRIMKIFETKRLNIFKAEITEEEVAALFSLWTNSEVVKNVGFPKGIPYTKEKIKQKLENNKDSIFKSSLIVRSKKNDQIIGSCKVGIPDENKLHNIDFMLFPEFHSKGYGSEIVLGIKEYILKNSDAKGIRGTPNIKNIASQKLFEKIGCKKVGQGHGYKKDMPKWLKDSFEELDYFVYVWKR
jgi:RimJ/RimL family protein N-acetyltransferase